MADTRVIGVDLGGTKILAGVVDGEGNVERRRETPTQTGSQEALLEGLDAAVSELLDDSIAALGFGIPSTIDQRTGTAISSVNIPLHDLDVRSRMRERFGLPVGIDNDAACATIGEWKAGGGRGTSHMVMLTLGTGVGGGMILDGKPYRGAIGAGGELGHLVILHDGPRCQGVCTGHGHLEVLASGTAATHAAQEAFGEAVDAHRLVRIAAEGDEQARGILRQLGDRLGSGLGTLVNVFNPELILIGGGFAAAGDLILEPARERMRVEALAPARDFVRVERAELGTAAGMVGAGFVALAALDAA